MQKKEQYKGLAKLHSMVHKITSTGKNASCPTVELKANTGLEILLIGWESERQSQELMSTGWK